MDYFGNSVTTGILIAQFLTACAAYSHEAISLKARFDWDLRALQAIEDHFKQRRLQNEDQRLSSGDERLLEDTAQYLEELLNRAQLSLNKIQRKGWLSDTILRTTWFARRSDLKEMEQEVFNWTQRFGVRVLGLPQQLDIVIPAAGDRGMPTIIESNQKLREFIQQGRQEKEAQAARLLLERPAQLISQIIGWRDISTLPLAIDNQQVVFSSRRVSKDSVRTVEDLESLKRDMGVLAAALHRIDRGAEVRLLKVEYYFYHPESMQFLFAQTPPYPTLSMMTLEQLIEGDPFPDTRTSLSQRLRMAYKLAEAVFFLHAADFLHKNITSSSIVSFQPAHNLGYSTSALDNTYLMGFDLIRGAEAKTTKEGTAKDTDQEQQQSIWSFSIFQHPDRLKGQQSARYNKNYDIYSLGVVLLEIGLWQPLSSAIDDIDINDPASWAQALSEVAEVGVIPTIGERYHRLITWCLNLSNGRVVDETEFVKMVLDPLDSMFNALY